MKTLLKNCALHSGERADILVEDGLIAGIGSFATADQVYDMTGYAAVLPGFIDAHMHLITGNIPYEDTFLRAWAQAGVTTLRDLGVGDDMRTHPIEKFIAFRDKAAEDPECAQCLTSGRFVAADGGYGNAMMDTLTGYGCKTPQDCADAVNELLDIGCDGIKTAIDRGGPMFGGEKPLLTTELLTAMREAAEQRGVWCCAHVLEAALVERLLDACFTQLAHMPIDRMSDETLERMVRQHVSVVPTICAVDAPRPPLPEGVELPPLPEGIEMPDTKAQERQCVDNVARFVKLGGKVAVGTDTMRMEIQPEVAGMPLRELRLLHEAGLSIDEVIDAATINAAEVCGIADQVGSIAVGKRANLIAVKDPIDEGFDALAHVEFVMNRGVVIKNI